MALNFARTNNHTALPLLCLHGVTRSWQSFLAIIPELSKDWQIYATDQRGHGKSFRAERYLTIDYVGDAINFLRTEIAQPTVIYGHSLGAMVAAAVAAEAPELVRAIILEDPPFHTMGIRIENYFMYPYFAALENLASNGMNVAALVDALGAIEINTPSGKKYLRQIRDQAALEFTANCVQQLDPAAMTPIANKIWLDGYELKIIAPKIQCPTLVMQADAQLGGMLTDDDVGWLEKNVADLTVVKVPGIGHQIHTTAPEIALAIADGFLATL